MPSPNSYLASFAKFLSVIRQTPYCQQLLKNGLSEYVETNIKSYPQHQRYKCHFVGSIAYVFATELEHVCVEKGIQLGKIIRQPIFDLLEFIASRENV
jgi:hypothetical protein